MVSFDELDDLDLRLLDALQTNARSTFAELGSLVGLKAPAVHDRVKRLEARGYIRGYAAEQLRAGVAQLKIELKYSEGEPVIKEIHRVSKPGRRVYSKIQELPRVYAGLGVSILSTPRGVLSDAEARAANVGGEVLCRVF